MHLGVIVFAAAFECEQCSAQLIQEGEKVNYSDTLLKQIRDLNDELDQYVEPANPAEAARREALLQALAWYVHKLQMRVLPNPCAASAQGAAQRCAPASHAAVQ